MVVRDDRDRNRRQPRLVSIDVPPVALAGVRGHPVKCGIDECGRTPLVDGNAGDRNSSTRILLPIKAVKGHGNDPG